MAPRSDVALEISDSGRLGERGLFFFSSSKKKKKEKPYALEIRENILPRLFVIRKTSLKYFRSDVLNAVKFQNFKSRRHFRWNTEIVDIEWLLRLISSRWRDETIFINIMDRWTKRFQSLR